MRQCLGRTDDEKCQGFEDRFSHSSGHYTVTIHDEDCPLSPESREERAYERADHERDMREDREIFGWDD